MIDFFFDIDGTLLPFGCDVPESAVKAIRRLRKLGNRAFLATGRSPAEIVDSVRSIGFDGGVYGAGATVYIGDEKVYHRAFTEEEKEMVLSFCRERGYYVLMQSDRGTYITPEGFEYWRELLIGHIGRMVALDGIILTSEIPADVEMNKLLYIAKEGTIDEVRAALSPDFSVVDNTVGLPADLMGEIVLPSVSKASGIDIIERCSAIKGHTVAIGDGANDMEMVAHAELGIAMGNATDGLKNIAGYITSDVARDGLAKAIDYAILYFTEN